jgi:hypothetical protein
LFFSFLAPGEPFLAEISTTSLEYLRTRDQGPKFVLKPFTVKDRLIRQPIEPAESVAGEAGNTFLQDFPRRGNKKIPKGLAKVGLLI